MCPPLSRPLTLPATLASLRAWSSLSCRATTKPIISVDLVSYLPSYPMDAV